MKILLTGANGYIGRRLLLVLLSEGHEVLCLLRDKRRFLTGNMEHLPHSLPGKLSIYEGDLLKPETLKDLPEDIEAAYYLVHSMSTSSKEFFDLEQSSARNFVDALENTKAKQIIYLSGISNDQMLSEHLSSRLNVEEVLKTGSASLTVLRAAIIIGSGSASFEIIRDLVEKLPVMIAPKWVETKCQPIAIRDVLSYLAGVLAKEESYNKAFDIGGPDVLSFKEMMLLFAEERKLKRMIINVPFFSPRLSSYWLYFVTATSYELAKSLVDSMKNEVVCKNDDIKKIVPIKCISYKKALMLAFTKIAQNEVVSSWTDALVKGRIDHDYLDNVQVPFRACFKDTKIFYFDRDPEEVRKNVWSIGGARGWYGMSWAWELRGLIDKACGGVGLRRGRRDPLELKEGDAVDFWRVLLADKEANRLILFAEMKLPGEAWLEFHITENNGVYQLKQEATFRPSGVLGRLYWYSMFPAHLFIFKDMGRKIIRH